MQSSSSYFRNDKKKKKRKKEKWVQHQRSLEPRCSQKCAINPLRFFSKPLLEMKREFRFSANLKPHPRQNCANQQIFPFPPHPNLSLGLSQTGTKISNKCANKFSLFLSAPSEIRRHANLQPHLSQKCAISKYSLPHPPYQK